MALAHEGVCMSHIHIAAIGAALAAKLVRKCPACHQQQKVLKEYQQETVVCTACGASIPPKKD